MAKILKRLLLIIPILFLFPKSVFADTNNIYFDTRYSSYSFTSDNVDYTTYNFNALDSEFILNYYNSLSIPLYNYVLYDTLNDFYLLFNVPIYGINSDFNIIDISSNGNSFSFYNNDNLIATKNVSYHYFSILSCKSEIDFLKSIYGSSSSPFILTDSNNNVLTQISGYLGYTDLYSYVGSHYNNMQVVFTDNFTLKFNGEELPLKSSSSPEEPEDPEEDIPIYNFNNNKYYVPNYEKGNCVEVLDKDTIRVFKDEFTDFYTDYYINSNYISKTGQVEIDYEKHCSTLEFTDIRYYGNDFPQILFITLVASGFSIGLIYLLLKRFRKR